MADCTWRIGVGAGAVAIELESLGDLSFETLQNAAFVGLVQDPLGNGNDHLTGDTGNDRLIGGEGVDVLLGGDGRDYLKGDEGSDDLNCGTGTDTMDGCLDLDTFDLIDLFLNRDIEEILDPL